MQLFVVPAFVIIIDQVFKFLANKNLLPQVGRFFEITSCNKGIAFGIELPFLAFVLLWSLSMTLVLYLIKTEQRSYGLLLVLGGALSNLIDRIWQGCVTDYITLLQIPTFNLADTAITLGVILFAINSFLSKNE